MAGILIEVITEQDKEYNLQIDGGSQSVVIIKSTRRLGTFVNDVEKALNENKDKVKIKKVTFQGSWNYNILKRITGRLESLGYEWWLDP